MATPLAVIPQLRYLAAWNTVPCYADDAPTVIERGYTDEGTIRPSRMTFRVNDAAAPTYNPSRPASLLYGMSGRGMWAAISCQATIRAWHEVASLRPGQSQNYTEASQVTASPQGKRWLDVEAYGPLYRVGQWSDTTDPPVTRTFLQFANLIGFWPGDDATVSTRVGNPASTKVLNFTTQDTSSPPGASASFVGTSTSSAVFSVLNASTTAGWQVFFSTKLSTGTPGSQLPFMTWRANGLLFSLELDAAGVIHLKLFSAGVLLADNSVTTGGTLMTDWVAWRAQTFQSGGNVHVNLAWYSHANGVLGTGWDWVATLDRLTSIRINATALVTGSRYADIGAVTTITDDLQSLTALQSFEGWAGESTVDRFDRLVREAGINRVLLGTSKTAMGPQRAGKLIDLIKECAATEDGLVFDRKDGLAITFRSRSNRTNQAVAMTLDATADIVPPFDEVTDNVGIANVITLTDRSGAVQTATKTTGTMSNQAYPAGIGVFKGGALPDVNVSYNTPDVSSYLPTAAAWYLARGTTPAPRWSNITIEVGLKSPGLQTAAKAIEVGDRIQVINRMPDPIDLQVIGVKETIGIFTWEFVFTCIPGAVFDTGSEDDTTHRLDAYASTIITAPTPATTGTSIVVGSPDPDDVWSTTSLPYPIIVAGEKMTVTACTAAALVSGTWRQTLTVTRSVNGVVKTQVVATPVNSFAPYREAW